MKNLEEKYHTEEGMSELSVADAMALNKENGFGDQVWPLVWLAALGGNGNGLLGGRNDGAAGVTVAGIEGLQNQINGLLNTINANTDVLQHDAIKSQLCNMATLIQSGNADITAAICKCCCDLKQQICDLGYQVDRGNADIRADICAQTNNLTMQNMTNTQRIIDGQARIIDNQNDKAAAILAKLNEQENNELREKNATLQSQLDKQEIITALSGNGG